MPRRVSEVGEGTDASNGVYGFIRELLVEGKDGRLVNRRGRYRLNWPRALDRYADYKARKKPHFKSKNHSGRKASNSLRSALLNFYKKEGAKEYKESQRVNDNGEIVKREFQMPPRVFESLFGNTVPSSGESGLSEQEDEREINSITSEDEIDAQSTPNSSDHGFDETMDQSCVDFQSTHNSSAHGFDETIDQSCVVAEDICPASGPVKGGYTFHISFPEPLSEDVSSGMAEFHGVATVQVHKLNPFTLSGSVPPSDQSGDVSVTVTTQSGQHLCTTHFQYVDQMREVAQQLVHDPAKRRSWFEMLLEEYGFFGTDSHFVQMLDRLNTEYQGITGAWLETISNDLPVSAEPSSLTSPHELLTSPNVDGVLHVSPDAALHGQTFDTSAVDSVLEDGILDEISEDLDLFGVVEDICPTSGSVKGGYRFYISLTEPLSQDVLSGMAEFEGVATVSVHKLNPFTLSGSVPSSDQPRDVPVRVVTQTGQCLGMTHFQYVDEMHDMARQLIHDPAKQASWFAILLEEYGFFGFDSDLAQVLDPLDMQCQGLSEEKSSDDSSENNSDTDYFADVETSSVDSLGYQTLSRSTSEDNISKLYSEEQMKASTQQSISSIGKGAFARNGIMLKTGQIREGVQRKSYVLSLRDSHFDSSLPEVVKGLDYTLAFHLAMGSTSIPRQLHTANESFLALRGSRKGILAELRTQIPVEKAIPVDWKSSDISVKQSGVHTHRDLWVFTSAFRPTRKTLFVYFADRRDALPPSYFFEDEDCESQIRCWKWKGSGNNSFKFTETLKAGKLLPGGGKLQMESHADPPVTYIVRDKQAQTQSESGTCLSWMHAMMHHCWTTESTEKASNITIFDRFLGPLGTDLMMSSGSRNDDSNKEKLNICQPVVSSGVGNTKINHEKWGMVESVFIDQTDCKIKGNEAKETKVEADSSKTERRTDAGKSLPAFTVDDSEIRPRSSLTRASRTPWVMLSGIGNDDAIKKAMRRIILVDSPDQLTDCKSKDTRGNENEVQADSSKIETIVDAGKSLLAYNMAISEFARAHDSAIRNSRTPSIISLSVADDDDTEFLSPSGLYEQESSSKGSSSSLRSDDDSKKPKLSIYHQVATSSVEKSKKNFKMCRMDAPILNDLTDGQIKGSEAKESKVQSDFSKPQTTADAGESLPTFVKSREVNLTKSQFNEMRVKAHFSKAKTSKDIFAKWARVASFSDMGEVMKVQADSSNTQTTIENLDEEVEHPGEVLNFRREFSGDADSGCSTVDGTSNRVRKPTSTLKVEFGRMHYSTKKGKFFEVKGAGGGTCKVYMERSATYQDCLLKAKELFFPNSSTPHGTLADMETPYLANFKLHKCNEEGFTVERFKEETKRNLPRIYLVTKPKTQTDSRPQRNSPSSDTLYGTEVNKVESSTRPASEADSGFQDHLSDISSDLDSMLQFLEDPNFSLMSNVDGQSPMEVTESTVQQGQVGTNRNGNSHTEDISLTAADLNTILPEITQDYYLDHSATTSNSLTLSEFSESGENRQEEALPPQDTSIWWEIVYLQPGSYRLYPRKREERNFESDPKPSKGIISQKGCNGCNWTIESFFRDPEKFIQKMVTAGGLCKERREQFILREILPNQEESWGRCPESNQRVYTLLAKLSHRDSGGQVVIHSLQLLLHLICKDNFERGHGSLLELERIMRLSIFSDEGVFRRDGQEERTLKLHVYSRILALLLKPKVLQGELLVTEVENDVKRILEELQRHQKQLKYKKKDMLRYSIEFIIMLVSHSCFLKPSDSLPTGGRMESFMEECQEFCRNPTKESKDLTLLRILRKKKKTLPWAELHSILYHLHGKVRRLTNS